MSIQKYRCNEILSDCFVVDDALLNRQMIKLVIQPLVENAIYHGIEPTDWAGTILVRAKLCPDGQGAERIWITVEDDGAGIPPDQLARLNELLAAGQLYFSSNYVRQLFKQKTGESFMEYLIRRRMETARSLLVESDLQIQKVAEETGYSSARYFASCFKKYFGCTPTECRVGAPAEHPRLRLRPGRQRREEAGSAHRESPGGDEPGAHPAQR